MTRLAISISGKTLFNVDLESEKIEVRDALITVFAATRFNNLLLASKLLERLPLPANRRFRRTAQRLDQFIFELIADRHARSTDQPDLLSVLVRMSEKSPKKMTARSERSRKPIVREDGFRRIDAHLPARLDHWPACVARCQYKWSYHPKGFLCPRKSISHAPRPAVFSRTGAL